MYTVYMYVYLIPTYCGERTWYHAMWNVRSPQLFYGIILNLQELSICCCLSGVRIDGNGPGLGLKNFAGPYFHCCVYFCSLELGVLVTVGGIE